MEFGAGISSAETRIDDVLDSVASGLVAGDGSGQCWLVTAASLQAVSGQYAELERNSPPSESQRQSLLSSSSKEQVTPW